MRTLTLVVRLLPVLGLALFLHYTLPQHDVVQITSTEVVRTDFSDLNRIFYAGGDGGSGAQTTRDLRFVNADKVQTFLLGFVPRDRTEVMVYRNEDTGWGWPPYFKFDSSDLQAEAASAARSDGWHVLTHYGWRIRWASIYPNAIALRPVDGPRPGVVPWFNLLFFAVMIALAVLIVRTWRGFRARMVDPALDATEDRVDEARADLARRRSRLRDWWRGS